MFKENLNQAKRVLQKLLFLMAVVAVIAVFFSTGGKWAGENPLYGTLIAASLLFALSYFLYMFKGYGQWGYGIIEVLFGASSLFLAVYIGILGKGLLPDDASTIFKGLAFVMTLLAPMYVLVRGFENFHQGLEEERKGKAGG